MKVQASEINITKGVIYALDMTQCGQKTASQDAEGESTKRKAYCQRGRQHGSKRCAALRLENSVITAVRGIILPNAAHPKHRSLKFIQLRVLQRSFLYLQWNQVKQMKGTGF